MNTALFYCDGKIVCKLIMSSKSKIFSTLAGKLGLSSERIIRKGIELHRLLQLKTQQRPINISETCQIVLCLDLAASTLGVPFEKIDAIKLSGVNKKIYINYFNTVSKLLGVEKSTSIQDLCIQFGISEATSHAQKILEKYKMSQLSGRLVEFDHPMYNVAAVLTACRKCKLKVDRAKLMDVSCIQKSAFLKLLSSFEKISEDIVPGPTRRKKPSDKDCNKPFKDICEEFMKPTLPEAIKEPKESPQDSYEDWKRKILEDCDDDQH
ncbi:Origin recognition complex subunit 6 [Blattella germanica]|nr:Origin recognition complex subunit 6 [Blattella germanica]